MRGKEVTVLAELRLLPDAIEKGKSDLIEFAQVVKSEEPDCLAIDVVHDIDDPTKITLIEKWKDRSAYEGSHLETPHMKAFVAQSSKYFDGPANISYCTSTAIGRGKRWGKDPYGR